MSTGVPVRGGRPRPGRPHPALARRRRAVRRARHLETGKLVVYGLGGLACAAVGFWLATGPLLSVRGVHISGYPRSDAPQLEAAVTAAAHRGSSLLSPPVGAIRRTATGFPWVQDVVVHRDWPVGLAVEIIPASPAAVVVPSRGTPQLVSRRGLVMGPATGHMAGLGRLRIAGDAPAPGTALPDATRAPMTFLLALEPEVAARVRGLRLHGGDVTGRLSNGVRLELGSPSRMVVKAGALTALLRTVTSTDMAATTYINLSVPEHPARGTLTEEQMAAAIADQAPENGTVPQGTAASHGTAATGTGTGATGTTGAAAAPGAATGVSSSAGTLSTPVSAADGTSTSGAGSSPAAAAPAGTEAPGEGATSPSTTG